MAAIIRVETDQYSAEVRYSIYNAGQYRRPPDFVTIESGWEYQCHPLVRDIPTGGLSQLYKFQPAPPCAAGEIDV
jgi:hypothetical protein